MPGLASDAHHLPPPGLDLTEPLTQRGQFPLPAHQGRQTALHRHVKARAATTGPEYLKGTHWGTSLHRHLPQVTRLEEARDVLLRRRADHHAPRLRHLLEPRGQVGGIAHRRVVHAQVITDLAHHDQARVDANAHLQAEPALGLERLGHVTDSTLNAQSGVHGPAWTIFVGERRAEQGHHPVARVLVDRALEAVHLGRDALEAAVDDVVHDLGVELLGEGGETRHVREQHRDLLALAFQGTARGENFLGQVFRRIGERCLLRGPCWRCRLGGRTGRPSKRGRVPHRHVPLDGRRGVHP